MMNEGIILFLVGIVITIALGIGGSVVANEITARRERAPFDTKRQSLQQLQEEFQRLKKLHDNQVLLGLNVARFVLLGIESFIIYAISILMAIWLVVFLSNLSIIPAWDTPLIRLTLMSVFGVMSVPIVFRGVLDLRAFRSMSKELVRLMDFDTYQAEVAKRLAEVKREQAEIEQQQDALNRNKK